MALLQKQRASNEAAVTACGGAVLRTSQTGPGERLVQALLHQPELAQACMAAANVDAVMVSFSPV